MLANRPNRPNRLNLPNEKVITLTWWRAVRLYIQQHNTLLLIGSRVVELQVVMVVFCVM